ncbi:acyltransferase [Dermabacter hominis]|uniref:acyltransferase family protein n=1 Tax=Dermabacter hominis TaxID=36740 RepID=UPI0021A4514E|nr:acyltransferase family protein [Dermabacter hominis]MCT2055105.1 acyltransferase [Dermabacter hominis]MCT2083302.1 acyltransferase [Dermabacter hominis]MCT2090878.1 acyltransferase [Dermabacter hominis]MCT2189521.1 acyltransferase [Dermabacter hominis]MCT2226205.1 acyltransferase [Dermabacter hominis]
MPATATPPLAHRAEPHKEQRVFRTDVHGLRGLAVFLVVIYHVFVGRVSGGVDVFLFISAYFLTGTFVRRMETGKPIAAVGYWGRTFKRLLPPTVVVTFAILAATYVFLPASTYAPMLKDAFFTLIQGENWWLINQATDYYAADRTSASPFQHFWSLSIQGQVFLAWPLLFAVLAAGLKAHERRFGPTSQHQHNIRVWVSSGIAIGAVTLASFIWSVMETAAHQQVAYFDTFARFWEFGLGGLVAIALPLIAERTDTLHPNSPKGRPWRFALSMLGVLALVSMGMLVDVAGQFPGWLAIWPLSAAAFIMVMGYNPILSSRPLQKLGGISYGLYLVHWPLLVLTLQVLEIPKAPFWLGVVLVIASLALAWLITKFVDTPFRRWKWAGAKTRRSVGVALVTVTVGLLPVIGAQEYLHYRTQQIRAEAYKNNPGAHVLEPDFTPFADVEEDAPEYPGSAQAPKDWWGLSGTGCAAHGTPLPDEIDSHCSYRQGETPSSPTIVYWGNSRVEQMAAGFEPLADDAGWSQISLLLGGCAPGFGGNAECDSFTRASLAYLLDQKPEVVVMNTTFVPAGEGMEYTSDSVWDLVSQLQDAGIRVVALRDMPRLSFSLTECEETNADGRKDCSAQISTNMPKERPDAAQVSRTGTIPIDLVLSICPDGVCVPAVGNSTVFLDANHITAWYGSTLDRAIDRQLRDAKFHWNR